LDIGKIDQSIFIGTLILSGGSPIEHRKRPRVYFKVSVWHKNSLRSYSNFEHKIGDIIGYTSFFFLRG